jgi:uncharacterized protein (TIGR00255 family)
MILSMTSFARRERDTEFGRLRWELRSVNHRYLDVSLRIPDDLRSIESRIRERISERLSRGKVDAGLRFQAVATEAREFALDTDVVKRVAKASNDISTYFADSAPVNPLDVLRWPGVMQITEQDFEPLYEAVIALLDETLTEMIDNRAREGAKLKTVIEQRCDTIDQLVAGARVRLPELRTQIRTRLEDRLGELKVELEPGRLEQEIVLLMQKMDVDEEIDRLTHHVQEVRHVLARKEPVGRRLDFLMQELNREANTLGSKSTDTELTKVSVELKVLIEQIREQVQNIE